MERKVIINASNKHFHPDSIPNAKVGSDRLHAKSTPQQPTRNIGEIDDEEQPTDMVIDSEEEESDNDSLRGLDCDSGSEWGDEMLFWEDYPQDHDAAPVGPIKAFLPPFKGPQPGPILGDALDMDPNDPLQAFQLFFPPEYFEIMLAATDSYGRLYVTSRATGAELQAFLGLVIHIGLINHTGLRENYGKIHGRAINSVAQS